MKNVKMILSLDKIRGAVVYFTTVNYHLHHHYHLSSITPVYPTQKLFTVYLSISYSSCRACNFEHMIILYDFEPDTRKLHRSSLPSNLHQTIPLLDSILIMGRVIILPPHLSPIPFALSTDKRIHEHT